jgi:long-chain acyl-CoA synthetase
VLLRRLRAQGDATPDADAVVCGDQRLSYRQLVAEIELLAGRLSHAGVRPGDAVVLALPNGISFVTAFLALAALRAVAIPVPNSVTGDELGRYIQDMAATCILVQRTSDLAHEQRNERKLPPLLSMEDLPESMPWTGVGVFDGRVVCQHSSGSSGQPKRVVRTQSHLVAETDSMASTAQVGHGDAIFCGIPLCHAHGLSNCLILALCNGAKLVILEPRYSPDGRRELPLSLRRGEILKTIEDESVSIIPGVPFLFALMAESSARARHASGVRLCFSAGSPLPRETYERFLHRYGLPLRQLYGTTETGAVALNVAETVDNTWDSVGHPLPGCEIMVDGRSTGAAEGEVAIRSKAMCDGYIGQPHLSELHFSDGWFRPGDLARRDEDGTLRVIGRVRKFIVSAGHKIDPDEVEATLLAHSSVKEVVVVGTDHPGVGELATAFVVLHGDARADEVELADYCRARLAPHKVPKAFRFLERLPRTSLGKISLNLLSSN